MSRIGQGAWMFAAVTLIASCGGNDKAAGGGGNGTIYFSNGMGQLWQFSLSTGEQHSLFLGQDPDRTTEGTFIYQRADLLESADGATVRVIDKIDSSVAFTAGFLKPRLSPDGTRIAYTTNSGVIFVVNRADGALVSHFPKRDATEFMERPSWTPDGRLVAAGDILLTGLFISDVGLGTWTRFDPGLDRPRNPDVSPDGQRVAFVLNKHIFSMHLDGSSLKQLTDGDAEEDEPIFSPDGGSIAAVRSPIALLIFPTEGGPVTDVTAQYPELRNQFSKDQFCWR